MDEPIFLYNILLGIEEDSLSNSYDESNQPIIKTTKSTDNEKDGEESNYLEIDSVRIDFEEIDVQEIHNKEFDHVELDEDAVEFYENAEEIYEDAEDIYEDAEENDADAEESEEDPEKSDEHAEEVDYKEFVDDKIVENVLKPIVKKCQICTESKCIEDTFDMLMCTHSCCNDCAKKYFITQITNSSIFNIVCPICNQPDLRKEQGSDRVHEYFAMMDITLRSLINDQKIHDLFQTKLRDLTLAKDKRFVWCRCSYGYYAENDTAACPQCGVVSGPSVVKNSLDLFNAQIQPSSSFPSDIAQYFESNVITCPNCNFKFSTDIGGCIHFLCSMCKHEFCSQCMKKYYRKRECQLLPSCENMGLHAHHTRVCTYYLRELEIVDLKHLLDTNEVSYEQTNSCLFSSKCRIKISPSKCNNDVHANCAGVCRDHYMEYLSYKIRKNKIDCIDILSINELENVLKRSNIAFPSSIILNNYRHTLIKLIQNNLPIYF